MTNLILAAGAAVVAAIVAGFGSLLTGATRKQAVFTFGFLFCAMCLPVVAVRTYGLAVCAAFVVGGLAVAAYLLRRSDLEILLGGVAAVVVFGGLQAETNQPVLGTILSIALVVVIVLFIRFNQDSHEERRKAERIEALAEQARAEAAFRDEFERLESTREALDARISDYLGSGLTLDEWNKQRQQ